MTQNDHGSEESVQGSPAATVTSRTFAEWTTLAISVVILLGTLGLISWLHFTENTDPANVTVEPQLDLLRQESSGYYLPVIVHNEGGETIRDVQIQAELLTDSGEPESADFTINFLVGGERVDGTFIFQQDPTQGDLTTAAGSYQAP